MAQKQKKSAGQLRLDLKELEARYSTVVDLQHEVFDIYGGKVARYLSMPGLERVATNIVKLKELSPEEFLQKGQKQIDQMETIVRKSQGHFKQAIYMEPELGIWMKDHPKDESILMLMPGAVRRQNKLFIYDSDGQDESFRRDSIEDLYGMADEITEDQARELLLETKSMRRLKTVEKARELRASRKAKQNKAEKPKTKANIKKAMKLDAQIKARAQYAKPKRAKNRIKSEQVKITEITF